VAHGAGLAVVFPAWMKACASPRPESFRSVGRSVWNVEMDVFNPEAVARAGIERMEAFLIPLDWARNGRFGILMTAFLRWRTNAKRAIPGGGVTS